MLYTRDAKFIISDAYTPAMDALRKVGFPPTTQTPSLADRFDEKDTAIHLTLEIDNEIAVYHRFTYTLAVRKSASEYWTDGQAPVPTTPYLDMGRFVIAPKYRSTNDNLLFSSFILMGMIYAQKAGFTKVVTMIKNERTLIKRCEALGFEAQSKIVSGNLPHQHPQQLCTLIFDIEKKGADLESRYQQMAAALLKVRGIKLNASFLATVTPIVAANQIRAKL